MHDPWNFTFCLSDVTAELTDIKFVKEELNLDLVSVAGDDGTFGAF